MFAKTVYAQTLGNPSIGGIGALTGAQFFGNLLPALITIAFIAGAVIFIFILIIGGIQYISSGGDKGNIQEARTRILNAFVGLVILFSFFAVGNLVGCFFGINIMSFRVGEFNIGFTGSALCKGGGTTGGVNDTPTPAPTSSTTPPTPTTSYAWCGDCGSSKTCNLRSIPDCISLNYSLVGCTGDCTNYTTPTPTPVGGIATPTPGVGYICASGACIIDPNGNPGMTLSQCQTVCSISMACFPINGITNCNTCMACNGQYPPELGRTYWCTGAVAGGVTFDYCGFGCASSGGTPHTSCP